LSGGFKYSALFAEILTIGIAKDLSACDHIVLKNKWEEKILRKKYKLDTFHSVVSWEEEYESFLI